MEFNDEYLNRTPNKWPRGGSDLPSFVIWHETASPNPDNPHGTLRYNLAASVESSYNYLIARDGTIYHYVDERQWISYHAGIRSQARGYVGWQVNVHSVGVEIDGANDGTPITPAQRDAIIWLMLHLRDTLGIPLDRAYHLGHKEVAPGYKSDPRGFSIDVALSFALAAANKPEPIRVDPRFYRAWLASGGIWAPNKLTPGLPMANAKEINGLLYQRFERGVARLRGETVEWLLLPEIAELRAA